MTLSKASRELIARGASCVVAFATHGLLSHDAADRLARCEELSFIVVTNTVPVMSSLPKDHNLRRKLEILSVAPMLAHHICALSGLPPPDIEAREPTHSLHAGSMAAAADDKTPEYLLKRAEAAAFKLQFGTADSNADSCSLFDDDRDERVAPSVSESVSSASEYYG